MRPISYRHWVAIQKTRLRGIRFFLLDVANSVWLTKIFQLLAQLSMGDLHEVLVVALPEMAALLPVGMIPDDDGPDAVLQAMVNEVLRGLHQAVADLVVTGRRDAIHLFGSRQFWKIKNCLPLCLRPWS